ncbi:aryl-alcohol dehydrogenase-like predicted oxidoreductase [Microterricola gilva]|uniref:Aryl-alcohol dehydrogenase-like predicted oxidoreductase n=1 Tax=Microterricola gilva TaxID=393267 RepID=A0A4Q8APY5_9MICO|nr:aldo/keto reductase [Microterricola gilva]RZU66251.1 aryl-alcohol dehydrogenase-like predicted oxidoreductase [Microterricola gilva]
MPTPVSAPAIPRRAIGASGLEASVLSLGSWHTYDRMHFEDAVELVATAHARGINLFDVGVYAFPGGPPAFTDVLFSAIVRAAGIKREDYLLSEKLWLEGFGPDGFRPQLERALFRVGTDYSDLVILGDLRRDDLELRDLVQDLAGLQASGIIRAWGVNNWSAGTIQALIDIAAAEGVPGPQITQLKYSMSRRSIPDGAPFARLWEQGITMQASDVMEGGILAGKVNPDREVGRDPGDIRAAIIASVPGVTALAEELETTPAQLAVAFTLTHPANTTTLFGATRLEQLEQNIAAIQLVERVGAAELRTRVAPFWADNGIVDPEGP